MLSFFGCARSNNAATRSNFAQHRHPPPHPKKQTQQNRFDQIKETIKQLRKDDIAKTNNMLRQLLLDAGFNQNQYSVIYQPKISHLAITHYILKLHMDIDENTQDILLHLNLLRNETQTTWQIDSTTVNEPPQIITDRLYAAIHPPGHQIDAATDTQTHGTQSAPPPHSAANQP